MCWRYCHVIFADDTNVFLSDSDLKSLMYKNEYIEIIKVFDRFKVNVLPSTTYMHFITRNTKIKKL